MHEQTPEDSGAVRKRVRDGREPPIRPVCYGHAAHPGTVNEGSPAKRRGVVEYDLLAFYDVDSYHVTRS